MKVLAPTLLCITLLNACSTQPTRLEDNYPMQAKFSQLSSREQKSWQQYLLSSEEVRRTDQRFVEKELYELGLTKPKRPPKTRKLGFDEAPTADWFSSEEAQHIGDILLSFQTPSGGWSKRTDMGSRKRLPGEAFGYEYGYIPTFDNHATSTQIQLLAQLWAATGDPKYSEAAVAGIKLIIQAQYPNGGWPQNFPLTGGYHDHITFNDEVFTNNLRVLLAVQRGDKPFDFVPKKLRKAVDKAVAQGIDCLLNTQVVADGAKTIWGAQHDALSLKPAAARKFEPAALASQESAEVVLFLMELDTPSQPVIEAVKAAVGWFQANALEGYRWDMALGEHVTLVEDAQAPLLWSRFCEVGSNKPVFGDRDGSVHYKVEEISGERRAKYRWYSTTPNKVLKAYKKWDFRTP